MPARDPKQEKEILDWIEAVMEEPLPAGEYAEVVTSYTIPERRIVMIERIVIVLDSLFSRRY